MNKIDSIFFNLLGDMKSMTTSNYLFKTCSFNIFIFLKASNDIFNDFNFSFFLFAIFKDYKFGNKYSIF